jgi:hypothetical protein
LFPLFDLDLQLQPTFRHSLCPQAKQPATVEQDTAKQLQMVNGVRKALHLPPRGVALQTPAQELRINIASNNVV